LVLRVDKWKYFGDTGNAGAEIKRYKESKGRVPEDSRLAPSDATRVQIHSFPERGEKWRR